MTAPRPRPWSCDPNYVTCLYGHLWRHHESNVALDLSRLTGYVYIACKTCKPTSYAFGIISTVAGCAWVSLYAISEQQFLERPPGTADEIEPAAMLHQLGYNPTYTPRAA